MMVVDEKLRGYESYYNSCDFWQLIEYLNNYRMDLNEILVQISPAQRRKNTNDFVIA